MMLPVPILQLPWDEAITAEQLLPEEKAAYTGLEMPRSNWRTALNLG
jgi:hypothetical protein